MGSEAQRNPQRPPRGQTSIFTVTSGAQFRCYLCWKKTVRIARNSRWAIPLCGHCLRSHNLLKEYPLEAQEPSSRAPDPSSSPFQP